MTSSRAPLDQVDQFRQTIDELQSKYDHSKVGSVDASLFNARKILSELCERHRGAKDLHMQHLKDLQRALQDHAALMAHNSERSLGILMSSGNAKSQKLALIEDDVRELITRAERLSSLTSGSLGSLENALGRTFSGLQQTVHNLSQLPVEARKLKSAASDVASLSKLDVASLRKYTELEGFRETAAGMDGIVDTITTILTAAECLLAGIDALLQSAPDKLKEAFEVPFPFRHCSCAIEQGAVGLVALVDPLNELLVEPLDNALRSTLVLLEELDFAHLIAPLEAFASEVGPLIDTLESLQRASAAYVSAVECVRAHCVCCGQRAAALGA